MCVLVCVYVCVSHEFDSVSVRWCVCMGVSLCD